MSRFDYLDPGVDPAYCNGLAPDPDEEVDCDDSDRPDDPPPLDDDASCDLADLRDDAWQA